MENVKEIIGDDDVTIIYSKWEEGKSLINHKHKRSQMKMMMSPIVRSLSFLVAYSSLFILGFCNDDDSSSKHAAAAESESQTQRSSGSFTMIMLITVFIALVVFSLLSFLLFKLWRKKKREEQYALLLKLFEEDDELELELGLKD
ncbi:unnamed protein product [Trifolium pratense]|uniref:Uncharacterized protein n=1 Tax=Trifolium pratense TaxID=57577 RepID=A0ACB0JY48_TRIPR|nr:unnamed protein product [Trifolium pratense]